MCRASPRRGWGPAAVLDWQAAGQSDVQLPTKEGDVRVTTAFNTMLGLPGAWVRDVEFGERR